MKQMEGWPASWTQQIGQGVLAIRRELGLSAQGLSDKCADLGVSIPRNTIANLENGRKATMPLHEIHALATALDVPFLVLAFWPDESGYVPVQPDRSTVAGEAFRESSGLTNDPRGGMTINDQVHFLDLVDIWTSAYSSARHPSRTADAVAEVPAPESPRWELGRVIEALLPVWPRVRSEPWVTEVVPGSLRDALDDAMANNGGQDDG